MIELPETRDLFYPSAPERIRYGDHTGLRLGRDLGADIVLLDSGQVVARTESAVFSVNSSLEQYRASLVTVGNARDAVAKEEPEDADAFLDELEVELHRIDAEALAADESYWGYILEQMRDEQF
jgi:hypothetical protein